MRRFLMALAAIITMISVAKANDTELTVSYGGYTMMDACDYHDHWHGVNTAWGALNAGVNFKIAPNLMVGPSYTFSSTSTGGKESSKIAYHAIMFNGRYTYYSNYLLQVYGHAAMGVVISHMQPNHSDSYNKTYVAMQISPVGVNVPISKSAAFFGEAGFGAQGLLQVGFRFSL